MDAQIARLLEKPQNDVEKKILAYVEMIASLAEHVKNPILHARGLKLRQQIPGRGDRLQSAGQLFADCLIVSFKHQTETGSFEESGSLWTPEMIRTMNSYLVLTYVECRYLEIDALFALAKRLGKAAHDIEHGVALQLDDVTSGTRSCGEKALRKSPTES